MFSSPWIWVDLAVIVLGLVVFVIFVPWLLPPLLRLIFFPRYGFRVTGTQNIPRRGPVVLATNHVTWIDALFLCAACPRRGSVLANAGFFQWKPLFALAKRAGMIPVPFVGPKAQRAAITAVRDALERGQLVLIFPEGQLTRNGMVGPFYRGLEVILKGRTDIAVVPVYIDNLWGSIFSFQGGRAFGKRPKGVRRVINVAFGPPLMGPPSLFEVRAGMLDAGVEAVGLRKRPVPMLETIDPSLSGFDHPSLGIPLTRSAANYDHAGTVQPGNRDGTVGLPLPGVAIRVVDELGTEVHTPETRGLLQSRDPGHRDWCSTGRQGWIDRDGFVSLQDEPGI